MRVCLLAFVAGVGWCQWLAVLPSGGERLLLAALGASLAGLACWLSPVASRMAFGVAGCCLGLSWAAWQAQLRLQDTLASINIDAVSRVVLQVADLPQRTSHGWRFRARVLSARPAGVPATVLVAWPASPEPVPGQVWRAALRLRPPVGLRNPGLFDYEGHLLARGVRAQGTVRGVPVRVDDATVSTSWAVSVAKLRYRVRERMQAALDDTRYGAVIIALALGDQAGIAAGDWQRFAQTGITHLVSISGAHVTLLAGLAATALMAGWRRLAWRGRGLAERCPAQSAGALLALLLAGAYCTLAGWGIPARRTFFMLAVVLVSLWLRLPLGPGHVLTLAAAVVVLLDPWAPLSAGFWLSFAAVAVLLAYVDEPVALQASRWRRVLMRLRQAAGLQWAVTLALMPWLAWLFQQLPLLSPLANALAIPVVGSLVTPLAVGGAALLLLPGGAGLAEPALRLAQWLFACLMWALDWLVGVPGAVWDVARPSPVWLLLALAGTAWALRPPGWPLRGAGWLLMLPALLFRPERPLPGEWRIHALDVGQGSALLVETHTGVTLFDTGLRYDADADAGARIVWPALRALGWRVLDELVLSHADIDHVGGLRGVLRHVPVQRSYASFDLEAWLRRDARLNPAAFSPALALPVERLPCAPGVGWQRDGVRFRFLHPPARSGFPWRRGGNADSCVLAVEGRHHRALLLGDIGVEEELALLAQGEAAADWVAAAHHGSATSSAPAFVAASGASHVVMQQGAWNRYQHPHPDVEQRWIDAGARVWRSDRDGAVVAHSRAQGLSVWAERQRHRRYWQRPQYDESASVGGR